MKSLIILFFGLFVSVSGMSCENSSNNKSYNDPVIDTLNSLTIKSQEQEESEEKISLAFVGDIMMGTTYPEGSNYLPASDGANIFNDVSELISNVDIACANLEGTLLDGKGQVKKCNDPSICYAFRMPTRYAKHLKNAGFDFVGIANNHINDFGPEGLSSTQKTLKENDILFAGLRGQCETAIKNMNGKKVGFAAFGHNRGTMSILNLDEVKKTVKGLKETCDLVVVSFHGGGEGPKYTHVPHKSETCFGENRGNVEAFAHTAIDAGADIVYGHGPHVTRALELYKDHLIMYSLGNFCTPFRVNLAGISGHAPLVTVNLNHDGTFNSGKIHSFIQQKGKGPLLDPSNSVAKNMKKLSMVDFPSSKLIIEDDGTLR